MFRQPFESSACGPARLRQAHPGSGGRARRCGLAIAAALCAGLLTGLTEARAEDRCAAAEPTLRLAQDLAGDGRPWQAAAELRAAAVAGCVTAMERLALLHWYGPTLHPGAPWSREEALKWFTRAAAAGSDVGQHMLEVARHTPPARPLRRSALRP